MWMRCVKHNTIKFTRQKKIVVEIRLAKYVFFSILLLFFLFQISTSWQIDQPFPLSPAKYMTDDQYFFNITWDKDIASGSYFFETNMTTLYSVNPSEFVNMSMRHKSGRIYDIMVSDLVIGTFIYRFHGKYDWENYWNTSNWFEYNIYDDESPFFSNNVTNISLNKPFESQSAYSFDINVFDDFRLDTVTFISNFTLSEQSVNITSTGNLDNLKELSCSMVYTSPINVGSYFWKFCAKDVSGNENCTERYYLQINKTNPITSLTLNSSTSTVRNIFTNDSFIISGEILDPLNQSLSIKINGTEVNNSMGNVQYVKEFNQKGTYEITLDYSGDTNFYPMTRTILVHVSDFVPEPNITSLFVFPEKIVRLSQITVGFQTNTKLNSAGAIVFDQSYPLTEINNSYWKTDISVPLNTSIGTYDFIFYANNTAGVDSKIKQFKLLDLSLNDLSLPTQISQNLSLPISFTTDVTTNVSVLVAWGNKTDDERIILELSLYNLTHDLETSALTVFGIMDVNITLCTEFGYCKLFEKSVTASEIVRGEIKLHLNKTTYYVNETITSLRDRHLIASGINASYTENNEFFSGKAIDCTLYDPENNIATGPISLSDWLNGYYFVPDFYMFLENNTKGKYDLECNKSSFPAAKINQPIYFYFSNESQPSITPTATPLQTDDNTTSNTTTPTPYPSPSPEVSDISLITPSPGSTPGSTTIVATPTLSVTSYISSTPVINDSIVLTPTIDGDITPIVSESISSSPYPLEDVTPTDGIQATPDESIKIIEEEIIDLESQMSEITDEDVRFDLEQKLAEAKGFMEAKDSESAKAILDDIKYELEKNKNSKPTVAKTEESSSISLMFVIPLILIIVAVSGLMYFKSSKPLEKSDDDASTMMNQQMFQQNAAYSNTYYAQNYPQQTQTPDAVVIDKEIEPGKELKEKLTALKIPERIKYISSKPSYKDIYDLRRIISHGNIPDDVEIYNKLATFYYMNNDLDSSVSCSKKVYSINNENKIALFNLADLYLQKKSFKEASWCFEELLKLDPENNEIQLSVGRLYKERKLYNKAIRYYEGLLSKNPQLLDAWNEIGEIYFNEGLYDKAEQAFHNASGQMRDNVPGLINLAKLHFKQHKRKEAIDAFEKAIKIDPTNETAKEYLLDYYIDEGFKLSDTSFGEKSKDELESALYYLNKAAELGSNDPKIKGKLHVRIKSVENRLKTKRR